MMSSGAAKDEHGLECWSQSMIRALQLKVSPFKAGTIFISFASSSFIVNNDAFEPQVEL